MLPVDPSSLFPVLYRKITGFGVVSPLVHLGIYPQAISPAGYGDCNPVELLAGENSEQSGLHLVLRIYLPL